MPVAQKFFGGREVRGDQYYPWGGGDPWPLPAPPICSPANVVCVEGALFKLVQILWL